MSCSIYTKHLHTPQVSTVRVRRALLTASIQADAQLLNSTSSSSSSHWLHCVRSVTIHVAPSPFEGYWDSDWDCDWVSDWDWDCDWDQSSVQVSARVQSALAQPLVAAEDLVRLVDMGVPLIKAPVPLTTGE
jgi:hypothetical protein